MRGWLEDETVENGAHAISCRSAGGVLPPVVLLTGSSGYLCTRRSRRAGFPCVCRCEPSGVWCHGSRLSRSLIRELDLLKRRQFDHTLSRWSLLHTPQCPQSESPLRVRHSVCNVRKPQASVFDSVCISSAICIY